MKLLTAADIIYGIFRFESKFDNEKNRNILQLNDIYS